MCKDKSPQLNGTKYIRTTAMKSDFDYKTKCMCHGGWPILVHSAQVVCSGAFS